MRDRWGGWDWVFFAAAALLMVSGVTALVWCDAAVGSLASCFGVSTVLFRFHLRLTHNRAWLMGRSAMVSSLVEANARGMSERDWLLAEADRDGFGGHVRARLDEMDRRYRDGLG